MTEDHGMTYLFSHAGREELRDFVDRSTLFAFDLDGTLAPIVADPSRIMIPPDVHERLVRLNGMASVAVVTGRARADAARHLGFEPRFLVGNHGAEGLPGADAAERGFVSLCRGWRTQLGALLPEGEGTGIVMEDKGATLSLHYRSAPARETAHQRILDAVSRLVPAPRRVSGKEVENLVPAAAPHKGDALRRIMRHLGNARALFVGDDVTDEDVFRLGDEAIFGVRVGSSAGTAARYFIRGQDEMASLLDEVLATF